MKNTIKPIKPLYLYKDEKKRDKETADVFLSIDDYNRFMEKLRQRSQVMKKIALRQKKQKATAKSRKMRVCK